MNEDGNLETWEYTGRTWNIENFKLTGNKKISELDTCINILSDIVQNGKNIYSIPDTYIGTDGNEHKTSAGYYTTDFLPIYLFDNVLIYTLYMKSESARFCAFYTVDKDFIGTCENGDGTNKEISIKQLADKFENVSYVRLTIANNSTYKIYTTDDKENTDKLEALSNTVEKLTNELETNNNWTINELDGLRETNALLLGRKITSTNLIALQNPKFIKNKYFSPSAGWTDRDNYNCHIWLEVKPDTQYYCMGNAAEFDENKEYLNLYHSPSGPSMASVTSFVTSSNCKYLVLNYSNTPQYIQPGTEYTDGYWLSEINGTQHNTVTDEYLDIEEKVEKIISNFSYEDPIMAGCKMVQSHGPVIDFSGAEVVSNALIKNANIKMFSGNAKSCCGVKAATDSYIKIATDISSWNSLTFVMFCPYDTHILTTGIHSGYIRMYLNSQGTSGYGTWFNGRCHAGWNFVTITKEELGQAVDAISNIYIKFEARDTVLNNVQFANVVLDCIIVDLKVKPTILINFDQLWYESQENGGYQKLFDNDIPATFFSKNYANMNEDDIAYIKDLSDVYGWELGTYSNVGPTNGVIERATNYTTAKESCNETVADFVNTFMVNTVSFAATQAQCNEIGKEAILKSGYIGIRYMGGLPMTYFNKEVGGWIQHHDVANLTLQEMKDELDKCITYGLVWAWFTHGICADGEQYMLMNDTRERGTSSGVQKTIFNDFIDYLKTKIDAGEIQAITFKEFYRQCGVEVR